MVRIRCRSVFCVWSWVCLVLFSATAAEAQTRLLRFPDVHGDRVVFTYGGDLWVAPSGGGMARRLTAHPGLELFAHFSPDGTQIAFTGQYDGDEQVYVVPAEGGSPKQLTFYPANGPLPDRWGYDNQVYGWTRDGQQVLFRSMRHTWTMTDTRLYTVPTSGGLPAPLPMPVSGGGDFSPDGTKLVYSPLTRDFRTWKRYQGGWAQDLYIFDLASFEQTQITDHPRTDRDPMWIGERIYFTSDRNGTLNLYQYDIASAETRQLTDSKTYDVRWPGYDDQGQIVYELNGSLQVLNTADGQSRAIDIQVPNDGLARRPRHMSVEGFIEDFGLSPKGTRAVMTARGDVFTLPAKDGPTRNLTRSSGAHDKWGAWSPDGSQIAFISDRSGEEQLYVMDQLGENEPIALTETVSGMRYQPSWSPDGKRIALSDKNGSVFVVEVATKKVIEVARDADGSAFDFTWSPKGGHLAMSLADKNNFRSLHIWSVEDGELRRVTDELFNEFEPVWDPDGNYLFYFSDRQFAPQIGSSEWNYVANRETGIYALALRKDVPHPFPPKSDEVEVEKKDAEKEKADDKPEEGENKDAAETQEGEKKEGQEANSAEEKPAESKSDYLHIDFEGLADRVAKVPVPDDNYRNLLANKGHLFYARTGAFYYGRPANERPELHVFSMEQRRAVTLAEGIGGFTLSPDGSKLLVRESGGFQIYPASPAGKGAGQPLSTSGLEAYVVPAEEWRQVFHEVWRRFRDFFYVENMHGYDWEALRNKYEPLLDHVVHRTDLNYVIGEMIGELNVGHAYNAGGDFEIPERADVALPGAVFSLDKEAGRYRLSRIYSGHNEESIYRSPLREIGVDVGEGTYVLAINGRELKAGDNPYQLLQYQSSNPVTLTVHDQPQMEGARKVQYRPLQSESDLVYLNWVLANRRRVEQMTGGRVAYIHLPNMGAEGIREFGKWFYGQIRKEGLIVDVRNNGGGNVSQMVIERLRRDLLAMQYARNSEIPNTYPSTVFHGPMVCVLNENSASDGDIFPAMFRQAGLGPLIGKRSWGGVVGITSHGPLIDGGSVNVPEFGFASTTGQWIIEGHGVDPDIEVANDPKSLIEGRDPQLERAIKEVTDRMLAEPHTLPARPAGPIKTP